MKLIITGGHVTPALAVIGEIKKQPGTWEIYFIGRKFSYEGENTLSWEYDLITGHSIPFYNLDAGKLHRRVSIHALVSFMKIPLGFVRAFIYVRKLKPDAVLSFGGYLALPVSFAAWFLNIPVVTHEQTVKPGLSNKIIALFARKICLSFPPEKPGYYPQKTVITGNPLRPSVFEFQRPPDFNIADHEKVIYLTGGNLGSHALNAVVKNILPDILGKYILIHQCGQSQTFRDYEDLQIIKSALPDNLRVRYYLNKYINDSEIGYVLNRSDLIISRSGANTVSEIAALGKPAIFIPLPWSGGGEQEDNARYLEKQGGALLILQKGLTSRILLSGIEGIMNNYSEYLSKALRTKNLKNDAAEKIITQIYDIFPTEENN